MSRASRARRNLSPAHIAGFTAFLLSGGLLFVRSEMAAVPLGCFLLFCLAASFLPRAGLFLPVISRGAGDRRTVALTFDDGPDPEVTPSLLDLLDRHRVPGTFFVVGIKAEAHPELVREILRRGHDVGNHSYRHDPLLMLHSRTRLVAEIARTQQVLASLGIRPIAFRPPVGITNPKLAGVLEELRMDCVTFSCRAGDFGNRRIGELDETILRKVRPGAIILLHDVIPRGGRSEDWLLKVERIIMGLRGWGYDIVPLSQLTGRPVMEGLTGEGGPQRGMKERFRQGLSQLSAAADQITASAGISGHSPWYAGHFPGHPILPGIAILALVEEAIVASELAEGRRMQITGVGRVRFRLPVGPDDRMEIRIVREERAVGWRYPFTVALAGEQVCTGVFTAELEKAPPGTKFLTKTGILSKKRHFIDHLTVVGGSLFENKGRLNHAGEQRSPGNDPPDCPDHYRRAEAGRDHAGDL
jgi:peptidoglycan/xylan/chitin deacetylase (PgdA/CDA1 family)/3-hydroxymyristoyl/3-hydroxydecanoyl-(acyl carrier protein) dehydratase